MIYDQEWQAFCAFIGSNRKRTTKTPKEKSGERTIYGVVSDLHVPFSDPVALVEAVDWIKAQGASRLVCAGDFLDCYSLSRFTQYEHRPIQEEFIEGRKILDYWSRVFASVWICEGNHEARERKHLAGQLTPELYQWFCQGSILERLATDMPNVNVIRRTIEGQTMHWICQVGKDAIVGHPEKFSVIPLRPADNFRKWLAEWHEVLRICQPRLVLSGHTHQAGIVAGHEIVVETGCLCRVQGYVLEPRLYSKPQRHAATVFEQVNGVTDLNSIRQYYPGIHDKPKPIAPDVA